ncbi:MAG: energy-coupling factor transporter transmembrane component T [Coriobacteriia bacterium]|nr:energy-coupling factor transporter transmembrane component T [Coriobacteriia bacterium]
MSAPVPFGQYVGGDSPVHRLEPRVKIGVTAAFTVALFAFDTWAGLLAATLVVVGAVALSGVAPRLVVRGLVPVAWLLVFTVVANAVVLEAEGALVTLGPLSIELEGLLRGLFFAGRILVLVAGTSLVTLTTSPVDLTDALARLMRPLRVVRFPADDAAMMLSLALRFIPTTAEEGERIIIAQTARGASFDKGGPITRARAWVPVLVPLFVRLFRRADDLAIAMESRCYTGVGRTRLRESRIRLTDWTVLVVSIILAIGAAVYL